ncbi:hypothetical protein [Caulobacter sp.]|uniref:hypothetical protein n=1 Tax=Caulobacter sp. TaxID=78 RepID=UPI002B463598|nr:hypothetical protein [Caulobacter sp.]HJV40487.1 hypothetical protein [Caulobacter sp.]
MLKELFRYVPPVTGLAALAAWFIALQQAMPRLLAGPLCSSQQDTWAFAGHCPACYVAALLTIVFLTSLIAAGKEHGRSIRTVLAVR